MLMTQTSSYTCTQGAGGTPFVSLSSPGSSGLWSPPHSELGAHLESETAVDGRRDSWTCMQVQAQHS